jgi:uncharacterized protein DUF3455
MLDSRVKMMVRVLLLMMIALSLGRQAMANAVTNDGPELPAQCSSIQVPEENQLAFHAYARGVQIYKWNGASWDFVAPRASLFAEPKFFGEVGSHYAGPTWESKSGSTIKGVRVPDTGCSPDTSAIAWLLLKRVESSGPGIFSAITYVQRVNTSGGIVPSAPGSVPGEIVEVPYTAEYYFYRARN